MTYHTKQPEEVQLFLDNLPPMTQFYVIFLKSDDSQRKLVGTLDPEGKTRKDNVPIMTDEGWKSFNRSRVLDYGMTGDS